MWEDYGGISREIWVENISGKGNLTFPKLRTSYGLSGVQGTGPVCPYLRKSGPPLLGGKSVVQALKENSPKAEGDEIY